MRLLIFILTAFSVVLSAQTISGVGYGDTQTKAKKEALADLSQNIKSDVRSYFESSTDVKGDKVGSSSKSTIKISSNLPILGAEFQVIDKESEVEVLVSLVSSDVAPLYTKELQKINTEIETLQKKLINTDTNALKLKLYEEIYSLLNEYERYDSVATVLGVARVSRVTTTKAEVEVELEKLSADIESLDMACSILANEFKQESIYVYPPLLEHTTISSEFSAVFLKLFTPKLKTVNVPKDAEYLLVSEYVVTQKALVLNYELLNVKTNKIEKSKTITLKEKLYAGIATKPKSVDFDTILNSGFASSSSLRVSLNSNRGSENLLFRDGDDVELFVKLNKMGYIYIVGYTQTQDMKGSYILELQEGRGNSKFVKFINADDASRWISLGQFSVEKPFGVESLQVIASNQKITKLPQNRYDEESGLYVISKDLNAAISQTRALKKKSAKLEFSEAVMSFSTVRE